MNKIQSALLVCGLGTAMLTVVACSDNDVPVQQAPQQYQQQPQVIVVQQPAEQVEDSGYGAGTVAAAALAGGLVGNHLASNKSHSKPKTYYKPNTYRPTQYYSKPAYKSSSSYRSSSRSSGRR